MVSHQTNHFFYPFLFSYLLCVFLPFVSFLLLSLYQFFPLTLYSLTPLFNFIRHIVLVQLFLGISTGIFTAYPQNGRFVDTHPVDNVDKSVHNLFFGVNSLWILTYN